MADTLELPSRSSGLPRRGALKGLAALFAATTFSNTAVAAPLPATPVASPPPTKPDGDSVSAIFDGSVEFVVSHYLKSGVGITNRTAANQQPHPLFIKGMSRPPSRKPSPATQAAVESEIGAAKPANQSTQLCARGVVQSVNPARAAAGLRPLGSNDAEKMPEELLTAGYKPVTLQPGEKLQPGDIIWTAGSAKYPHGHIATVSGEGRITSDFVQKGPNVFDDGPHTNVVYRDPAFAKALTLALNNPTSPTASQFASKRMVPTL